MCACDAEPRLPSLIESIIVVIVEIALISSVPLRLFLYLT
jgi:hypothetical protein